MDDTASAFRRTQSLRYPKGSSQSPSCNNNGLSRRGTAKGFRSRSSRRPLGSDSASSLSRMTPSQKQALVTSWRLLKSQAHSLMRKILIELEIVAPKVKDIFYKAALVDCFVNKEPRKGATVDEHIKLLIQFFDDLINNIDSESESIAMVKKVGQHHAILNQSCGFNANIWEQLGEISMEKICSSDSVQKTREAGRAWRALIAFVTDELRCGFDGEARVFSRKSSFDIPDDDEAEHDRQNELLLKLQEMRMEYNSTVPL